MNQPLPVSQSQKQLVSLLEVLSFLYLSNGHPHRAIPYLRSLISLEKNHFRSVSALALAEVMAGEEAEASVQKAIQLARTRSEKAIAFFIHARLASKKGREQDARASAQVFERLRRSPS